MTNPICWQCGKPTPADSIHTCSPQQPREWVTYRVQVRRGEWWLNISPEPEAIEEAMEMLARHRTNFPDVPIRAVRIRHTEEVIG